jgi:hypothetical protein
MAFPRSSICLLVAVPLLFFFSCDLLDLSFESPPTTKEMMMGVWEVVEAEDENGDSILSDISFPVTAFHLAEANSVNSTGGPMFMNIVYGNSKYTQIASKIDQVFDYTSLSLTEGEWFIEGGYPERFTIEMKLQGLPGQGALTTLLNALGIAKNYLDMTVYHKFIDVKVSFPDSSDSVMIWEFDDETTAVYNSKDSQGNLVLWYGWPTDAFGRYRFVFKKRVKTVKQLITGN